MAIRDDPQMGLTEQVVDDALLERALNERERLKEPAKQYRQAHKEVMERLTERAPEGPIRVGRFRINPTSRTGGGFEIPEWESAGFNIKAVSSEEET